MNGNIAMISGPAPAVLAEGCRGRRAPGSDGARDFRAELERESRRIEEAESGAVRESGTEATRGEESREAGAARKTRDPQEEGEKDGETRSEEGGDPADVSAGVAVPASVERMISPPPGLGPERSAGNPPGDGGTSLSAAAEAPARGCGTGGSPASRKPPVQAAPGTQGAQGAAAPDPAPSETKPVRYGPGGRIEAVPLEKDAGSRSALTEAQPVHGSAGSPPLHPLPPADAFGSTPPGGAPAAEPGGMPPGAAVLPPPAVTQPPQSGMLQGGETGGVPSAEQVVSQVREPIVQALHLGRNHVRVRLEPEGLGPVRIDLQVTGDRVHLRIHTEHLLTRQVFEAGMPELRQQLGQNGLVLGESTVEHRGAHDPGGRTPWEGRQQGFGRQGRRPHRPFDRYVA